MTSPERLRELAEKMNPDTWRCSMCGLTGDLAVIVPKHDTVAMATADDGTVIPLVVKLHDGPCREAWEKYGPPGAAATE